MANTLKCFLTIWISKCRFLGKLLITLSKQFITLREPPLNLITMCFFFLASIFSSIKQTHWTIFLKCCNTLISLPISFVLLSNVSNDLPLSHHAITNICSLVYILMWCFCVRLGLSGVVSYCSFQVASTRPVFNEMCSFWSYSIGNELIITLTLIVVR